MKKHLLTTANISLTTCKLAVKRKLLFLLFCGCSLVLKAGNYVYIYNKTGEKICFAINNSNNVTVDSGNIVVKLNDKQILFPLSDYVTFTFEKELTSSYPFLQEKKELSCRIENQGLILTNLPPRSKVCVYSLSGTLLFSSISNSEGRLVLNLGDFAKQVVLVNTISKNFKIYIQ